MGYSAEEVTPAALLDAILTDTWVGGPRETPYALLARYPMKSALLDQLLTAVLEDLRSPHPQILVERILLMLRAQMKGPFDFFSPQGRKAVREMYDLVRRPSEEKLEVLRVLSRLREYQVFAEQELLKLALGSARKNAIRAAFVLLEGSSTCREQGIQRLKEWLGSSVSQRRVFKVALEYLSDLRDADLAFWGAYPEDEVKFLNGREYRTLLVAARKVIHLRAVKAKFCGRILEFSTEKPQRS